MVDSTLRIPCVPQSGWRIFSFLFVAFLFSFGVIMFVFSAQGRWSGFWLIWFGFIGTVAILILYTEYTEVNQQSGLIIQKYRLFGAIPIWSRTFQTSQFTHIKRHVARARGYDNGNHGIYRPVIYLERDGSKSIQIQIFADSNNADHLLSKDWAEKIAIATKLPLVDVIELWEE